MAVFLRSVRKYSHGVAGLAFALMCMAALFYSPLAHNRMLGNVLTWGGGVLVGVGFLSNPKSKSGEARIAPTHITDNFGWNVLSWHGVLTLIGIVCLLAMAEGNAMLLGVPGLNPMSVHVQAALFVVGVVLVTAGNRGISLPQKGEAGSIAPTEYIILMLIVLLGFAVRVVNLEDSVHFFVDEMHFSNGVMDLRDFPTVPLLQPMNAWAAFPRFFAYLQTFSVEIFGPNLIALRMVSVLFGVLTIPAVYFLARELFDRHTGLLAALLLATFPPHIHLSRLGLNNIADPFFGVMALAFVARGIRRGGQNNFVLAGVMLGLTQYWYEGGKLVYPALIWLWLFGVWLSGRIRWQAIARTAIAFVLVMIPNVHYLLATGGSYTPRLDNSILDTGQFTAFLLAEDGAQQITQFIETQLSPALYHLIDQPDGGAFYYGGHTALILPYLLPFFLYGCFVVLWRRRIVLLLWMLLPILGNSLLESPDWTARFVVLFPALVMMMAVGMRYLLSVLTPSQPPPQAGEVLYPHDDVVIIHLAMKLYGSLGDAARRSYLKTVHKGSVGALRATPWFENDIHSWIGEQTHDVPSSSTGRDRVGWKGSKPFKLPNNIGQRYLGGSCLSNRHVIVAIVTLMLVIVQMVYYFGPHLTTYNEQIRPFRDHQDVVWRSREFPEGTHVYLFTDELVFVPHFEGMQRYWQTEIDFKSMHPLELLLRPARQLPQGGDIAIFIQPENIEVLHYLSRIFDVPPPQYSIFNVPDDKQYALYYLDLVP